MQAVYIEHNVNTPENYKNMAQELFTLTQLLYDYDEQMSIWHL